MCCFGHMEAHLVSWEMLGVKPLHTALPTLAIKCGQWRAAEGNRQVQLLKGTSLWRPLNHQKMWWFSVNSTLGASLGCREIEELPPWELWARLGTTVGNLKTLAEHMEKGTAGTASQCLYAMQTAKVMGELMKPTFQRTSRGTLRGL